MAMKTLLLVILQLLLAVDSQNVGKKTIVHMCDPRDSLTCGTHGSCVVRRTGNRCKCPPGFMGLKCKRPCQDIYKSCARWKEEGRCDWTKPISPFFEDNCAETCDLCKNNGRGLKVAVPPILEPLTWLVGRWETRTTSGKHFPTSLRGPYREILDVTISEVPMFDRPALNISVSTKTLDGSDEYSEVGFITLKPFNEDTGFVVFDKPAAGFDKVAIELISSAGLTTVEVGELRQTEIVLELSHSSTMFPDDAKFVVLKSKRSFKLDDQDNLIEVAHVEHGRGMVQRWSKHYYRAEDYLKNF